MKIYQLNIIYKIKKDYKKNSQNLSKEKKEREQKYGPESYKNLSA